MANKPLQSIKFPDLPDTYIIPVVDSTLAVSGAAADAKQTGDSLADKVDKVSGKGLSTEDYTTEEKTKLADVETGANKTIIDNTLTQTGQAADAKIVGDALVNLYPTDTATGAVANFPDGADSIPMKDVLVHIEPVQDLHGYDSPWPAGGGKNLLDPAYRVNTDSNSRFYYNSDGLLLKANTAYTLSVSIAAAGLYINSISGNTLASNFGKTSLTYTPTEDVLVKIDVYFAGNYPALSGGTESALVQLEIGSSATSYNPYSNICPITGWTGCVISHSGADMTNPTTYSITFPTSAGTVYGGTLNAPSGVLTVDRAMLYAKDINFTETPVALNDGTGYYIYGGLVFPIASKNKISNIYKSSIIANAWKDRTFGEFQTDTKTLVITLPPEADTLAKAKQWIIDNDPYFVYELATPITYTLTPQEITSLLGENNVWADTGDSEVEYRADTKMYITKKITEAVSALS